MELLALQPSYQIIPPPIKSGSTYYFKTDSGIEYEVKFGRKQDNVFNTSIVFGVLNDEFDGEEYSMTNQFEVYRVMATIVKIVKKYMDLHPKISCYEYSGEPTEKEANKVSRIRLKLYDRYLKYVFNKDWQIKHLENKTIVSRFGI